MSDRAVTVTELDHIVLRCGDIETTLAWYQQQLGLAPVRVEAWRAGEVPFPSVRVNAHTIVDLRLEHPSLEENFLSFYADRGGKSPNGAATSREVSA